MISKKCEKGFITLFLKIWIKESSELNLTLNGTFYKFIKIKLNNNVTW